MHWGAAGGNAGALSRSKSSRRAVCQAGAGSIQAAADGGGEGDWPWAQANAQST